MSATINFILSRPLVPGSMTDSSETAELKGTSGNVLVYLSTEATNIPKTLKLYQLQKFQKI